MKVILLQELKGRGGEGDVIDVAQGFAVNYLLPRKIAIHATSGNLKQLELRKHNIKKREDQRIAVAGDLASALEGKTVNVFAKAGEEGRLFGSVTSAMVADAIQEQLGIEVDRRKIETHGHIKDLGPHAVDVSVYREVKARLNVEVVAEGGVIPTTVVAEVEGVNAKGESFVAVVEETSDQAAVDADLQDVAADVEADAQTDADGSDEVAEESAQ